MGLPVIIHIVQSWTNKFTFFSESQGLNKDSIIQLAIRWAIGSLNKQNKKFEQNCIFERAGRGTIVRVTISMSITSVENHTKVDFTGN